MDDNQILIHAKVPRDLHARLKAHAKADRRSLGYVIAEALGPGLDALKVRDARIAALIDGEVPQ